MTVLVLGLGVFAMNSTIALELDRLRVFDENDVLFHTDLPCRLSNLAHGWCDLGRGYVHPNLANLSSLPIRALARLAVTLGVGGSEAVVLRRELAVFYATMGRWDTGRPSSMRSCTCHSLSLLPAIQGDPDLSTVR